MSAKTANGGMEAELKHRLGEGAKIMGGFTTLRRKRGMTTDVNIGMLESMVVPIALYRSALCV